MWAYQTKVQIIDVSTRKLMRILEGNQTINACIFSADGKTIITGGYDHSVRLWDFESGKNIQSFEGHTKGIQTLALCSGSEGEEFIASGSEDTFLRLWSLKTNTSIKPLQRHTSGVNCCTFSPDGTVLASGG